VLVDLAGYESHAGEQPLRGAVVALGTLGAMLPGPGDLRIAVAAVALRARVRRGIPPRARRGIYRLERSIGPDLWRRWDKPVIRAVVEEVHRHGRLVHVHFHGRCLETVADFAELGIDCVCPFERPPGGDVAGLDGLRNVARLLDGRVTMNGNVHTVETLLNGTPDDVRREAAEIMAAFEGSPRVIVGTGDQVGAGTPDENIFAMIDAVRVSSR